MHADLNENFVKKLQPVGPYAPKPNVGYTLIFDSSGKSPTGFAVRITLNSAVSFVFNYRCRGRRRRLTIGEYPTYSLEAARKEANALRHQIDDVNEGKAGTDPLEQREATRREHSYQTLRLTTSNGTLALLSAPRVCEMTSTC